MHSRPHSRNLYHWQGKDHQGNPAQGQTYAQDHADLRRLLARQQIIPVDIKQHSQRWQWRQPNTRDVALFSRQLSVLLAAKIPVLQALQTLADGGSIPRLQPVISQVHCRISSGQSLSAALAEHPKLFDTLYLSMVQTGENSGQLDQTLTQLSQYLNDQLELRAQLRNALSYPLIVMLVALGIAMAMLTVVVPIFADIFRDFQADLPVYTLYLLAASKWLQAYGLWLLIGLFVLGLALMLWRQRSTGLRSWLSRRAIRFPVFGKAVEQAALARFTGTVATLYNGGVPLPDTLALAAHAADNYWYAAKIRSAATLVRTGVSLSNALQQQPHMDPTTVEMTRIGETTGRLSELYYDLSEHYHQEAKLRVDTAKKLLEPAMILFIGGLVAALVLALYLPIIQLVTVF